MAALAVAPGNPTPRLDLLLARFSASGEILWLNEAARAIFGSAKHIALVITSAKLRSAWSTQALGHHWLLVATPSKTDPPLDHRLADLNRELLKLARRQGSSNQTLAKAGELVADCRLRATEQRSKTLLSETEERAKSNAGAMLVDAIETERGLIARELHDNAAQSLAGVLLNLQLVERQLDSAKAEAVARLERSKKLAALALDQIRRTSHALHPPDWDSMDVRGAVESLIESMAIRSKLDVVIKTIELRRDLHFALKATIHRIIQESLMNVLKHSGARFVSIEATESGGCVHLVVQDDGRGFDPQSLRGAGQGLGLQSIRHRVQCLAGRLEISNAPDGGARLSVFLPTRGGSE